MVHYSNRFLFTKAPQKTKTSGTAYCAWFRTFLFHKEVSADCYQDAVGAATFAPFGKQFEAELVASVQVEGTQQMIH